MKKVIINLSQDEAKFLLEALRNTETFLKNCYLRSKHRIKEEMPEFENWQKNIMAIRTKIANAPTVDLTEKDLNPKRGGISVG